MYYTLPTAVLWTLLFLSFKILIIWKYTDNSSGHFNIFYLIFNLPWAKKSRLYTQIIFSILVSGTYCLSHIYSLKTTKLLCMYMTKFNTVTSLWFSDSSIFTFELYDSLLYFFAPLSLSTTSEYLFVLYFKF